MIKESFYDNQQVTNADLNTAVDNAEQADKDLAKEGVGYGITSGLSVVSVGGQMQILVNVGTLIDKTGQRCAVAQMQPTIPDGDPAVGPGQERWTSVFLKVERKLTSYEEDPSGGVKDITNYTVQTPIVNPNEAVYDPAHQPVNPTQILYIVYGAVAAIDSAVRPALDSEAILLCDLNVRYGQTDYTGTGTIDFQRTELLRRIEPDESWVAPVSGGLSSYSLVRQYQRGQFITREYIARQGGMLTTVNAEAVASSTKAGGYKWKADDYDEDSLLFALGGRGWGPTGFSGAFKVLAIEGGTYSAPWADAEGTGGWGNALVSLPA